MEAAHFPLRFPTGYKAGLPALRSLRSATVPPARVTVTTTTIMVTQTALTDNNQETTP